MPSTEETNPINPNPASRAAQGTSRTKPDGLPRSDKNFKKLIGDRPSKEEEDEELAAVEDSSDAPPTPSLFELSAKSQVKTKLPPTNPAPFFTDKQPVEESFLKQPPPLVMHEEDETGMATSNSPPPQASDKPSLASTKKEGRLIKQPSKESVPTTDDSLTLQEGVVVDQEGVATINPKDLHAAKGLEEQSLLSAHLMKKVPEKPVSDNFLHGEVVREEVIKGKKGRPDVLSLDTDATVLAPKKEKGKIHTKVQSAFTLEKGDLSTINPHLQTQSPLAFLADRAENRDEQRLTRSAVKDIVEQIAANMQTVQSEGKTETIVTLRYPPILEGATVTLTAFEGTKREFNLSFANLTGDAKQFLDRKITEDSLVETLARQDIIVHTLTTSTLPETRGDADSYQYFTREEREQQRERQSEQDKEEQA